MAKKGSHLLSQDFAVRYVLLCPRYLLLFETQLAGQTFVAQAEQGREQLRSLCMHVFVVCISINCPVFSNFLRRFLESLCQPGVTILLVENATCVEVCEVF